MESLEIFQRLHAANARYVLVGAWALIFQGVEIAYTQDLDLAISLSAPDRDAILAAFRDIHPVPPRARVAPPWDEFSLRGPWTKITTDFGEIDFLVKLPGIEDGFEGVYARADMIELKGIPVRVASLDDLASMKRASTRIKDRMHLDAIEAIQRLAKESETGAN